MHESMFWWSAIEHMQALRIPAISFERRTTGGVEHDIPNVRLHFRRDAKRRGGPAQDHRRHVAKYVVVSDVHSSAIPPGTRYRVTQRALVAQRSHARNLWHSMGEDSADLYVRMCR